jgi:dihydrofolate reductase
MRKVILNVAVSLDGFIEGPNGEYDWCFTDSDYGMNAFLANTDAIFFGRKSYEVFTTSFGEMWNDKKHYVFSNSIKTITDAAVLINGDIKSKVSELKDQTGKDIWLFGGASLARSFLQFGLIDEFLLAIHPLLLGSGTPLFLPPVAHTILKLTESIGYASGLVQNRYTVSAQHH